MEQYLEYPGPSMDDYANVLALNTAFIECTSDLKGPQRGRLAMAPFLLFSFRERDAAWWDEALLERQQADWTTALEIENPELRQFQVAALSFLWQLGRRNPYALRVISGVSVMWCDKVTELPLVTMLNRIGTRGDFMISRLDNPTAIGERLLGDGTSSKRNVRRSSQLTALQALLTSTGLEDYPSLPAAACSMSAPVRVMEKKL